MAKRETIHVAQAYRRADGGDLVADQPEASSPLAPFPLSQQTLLRKLAPPNAAFIMKPNAARQVLPVRTTRRPESRQSGDCEECGGGMSARVSRAKVLTKGAQVKRHNSCTTHASRCSLRRLIVESIIQRHIGGGTVMISRRNLVVGAAASSLLISTPVTRVLADEGDESSPFDQLIYPPFGAIDAPSKFGYSPPTRGERQRADDIIKATPSGPTPLAVARSFVDRFYVADPNAISQWPAPASWNPLVVSFFSSTSLKVNSDMVSWCAAFANWCLERAGRVGSRSAASQSFLSKAFKRTEIPNIGDLAVFTCYDVTSGKSIGLGHVAFVSASPGPTSVKLLGGNTSKDGHSSIICERAFLTGPRQISRTLEGRRVPCIMKLNTYISIV